MNQDERNFWLSKQKWTGKEAVYLMLDIDPNSEIVKEFEQVSHDSSFIYPGDNIRLFGFFENIDNEFLSIRLQQFDSISNVLSKKITEETDRNSKATETYSHFPNLYYFNGDIARNPFGGKGPLGVTFSTETFKKFAEEEVYPIEKYGADVPIFGFFHSQKAEKSNGLNTQESKQNDSKQARIDRKEAASRSEQDEAQIEVIHGVTVADIRSLLDESSEEYRPRLAALISALLEVREIKVDSAKFKKKFEEALTNNLTNLKIGSYNGSSMKYATEKDMDALKRIALVNKTTKGGRPSN